MTLRPKYEISIYFLFLRRGSKVHPSVPECLPYKKTEYRIKRETFERFSRGVITSEGLTDLEGRLPRARASVNDSIDEKCPSCSIHRPPKLHGGTRRCFVAERKSLTRRDRQRRPRAFSFMRNSRTL